MDEGEDCSSHESNNYSDDYCQYEGKPDTNTGKNRRNNLRKDDKAPMVITNIIP
jgi:hypothetical protein